MTDDLHDFQQFMQQREAAARAYVQGDAAPLGRVVTHTAPATFFAPGGGALQGADAVWTTYEHDAGLFAPGGDSHLEILEMGASDGIAYWVGFQHATAHMHATPDPVPMRLRVTEVFRRADDGWKMVHRHADTLMDARQP